MLISINQCFKKMKAKGTQFEPGKVTEWLDCGNKNATVFTNGRILSYMHDDKEIWCTNRHKLKVL